MVCQYIIDVSCFACLRSANPICDSHTKIPISLILNANDTNESFKYDPHPDFHVHLQDLPLIILEVTDTESDETRMLLQAACISRIGRMLQQKNWKHADKPFFNMAIYIDQTFTARQHILWQPHDSSRQVVFDRFQPDHD